MAVQFDEEKTKYGRPQVQAGAVTRFFIRHGLASNPKNAQWAMSATVVLALAAALYLFFSYVL